VALFYSFFSHTSAKSKPHGTTVWLREEADVQRRLGVHAVIAGVQLYADATVVNLKGRSVHPVYICLESHPYEEKINCIETIAYLPKLGLYSCSAWMFVSLGCFLSLLA
jgi:hypothetical protein